MILRSLSAIALALAFLLSSCGRTDAPAQSTLVAGSDASASAPLMPALTAPYPNPSSSTSGLSNSVNADALERIRQAISKTRLSTRPPQCIALEEMDSTSPNLLLVSVREKHGGDCGGDPSVSVRLFSVQLDLKTGKMLSDAGSVDGEFKALKSP